MFHWKYFGSVSFIFYISKTSDIFSQTLLTYSTDDCMQAKTLPLVSMVVNEAKASEEKYTEKHITID